jgi:hypothetical protein
MDRKRRRPHDRRYSLRFNSRRLALFLAGVALFPAAAFAEDLPSTLSVQNGSLLVTLQPRDGTFSVLDKRNGKTWTQQVVAHDLVFTKAFLPPGISGRIDLEGSDVASKGADFPVHGKITLDGDLPEFTVSISGDGAMAKPLTFPQPFVGGTDLIVPLNEGIRYPVNDATIRPSNLVTYGGHGICMPFWGLTDGEAGQMAIFETPNDGRIDLQRSGATLHVAPQWDAQKGRLGYERRLRYVFLDRGGYVAMCKRYRAYAQKIGLFKTFAEKRVENPNIDRLIGAANVWYFKNDDSVPMAREMIAAGIGHMLWSNAQPPHVGELDQLGLLTGCYDLYQDIMNPAKYPELPWIHPDWIPQAWPSQLVLNPQARPIDGWKVTLRDGTMYPCGVLSDRFAPAYARTRIKAALEKSPYTARFIDTTTASAWREDYSPVHPQTRTECRRWRMELLDVVSKEFHLVTGSETGLDAAVPSVAYFEGMMSLAPYRLPDSGRDMQKIWSGPPPENLVKFQTGPAYRLPLWELVYHDCVVADWYWGDYDNKIPSLWDRRDLFNVLYGTVSMFMFDRAFWTAHKDRFVQSYRNTCPLARAVGYSEMIDHRCLTPDALVQQTRFANGVTVTVNFGSQAYALDEGRKIAPGAFLVSGAGPDVPSTP